MPIKDTAQPAVQQLVFHSNCEARPYRTAKQSPREHLGYVVQSINAAHPRCCRTSNASQPGIGSTGCSAPWAQQEKLAQGNKYLPSAVPAEPGPESTAVLGPVASLLLGPELAARLAAEDRGGALGGSVAACSFALPSTQHFFCGPWRHRLRTDNSEWCCHSCSMTFQTLHLLGASLTSQSQHAERPLISQGLGRTGRHAAASARKCPCPCSLPQSYRTQAV